MSRMVWRLVAVWVLPPLCLLGLIFVTPTVPETYQALRGQGEHGHLSVERLDQGKRCSYYGAWRSEDGRRTIKSVWVDGLDGECKYKVGDAVPSLYVGNPKIVYVAGDYAFWFAATISLFSAVYLIGFVTIAIKRRWRRLKSPTA